MGTEGRLINHTYRSVQNAMKPLYGERRDRFRSFLKELSLSGAVITDFSTITYLFGFLSITHSRLHPAAAIGMVPAAGSPTLLLPEYEEPLSRRLQDPPLVLFYHTPQERLEMILSKIDSSFRGDSIGVERRRMSVELWEELEKPLGARGRKDITERAIEARSCKDSWEVAQVVKAATLARHALDSTRANVTREVSELGLQAHMEQACATKATSDYSGDTVQTNFSILCRPELVALHDLARADQLPCNGIGFVLAKVRVNGYWADLARTFFVGDVAEEAREAYEVATIAQQEALNMVAPEVPVRAVVAKIDSVLQRTRFGGMRRFRAIRGLGLETSEHPSEDSAGTFKQRNLFSLQCYIVGRGFAVGRSDTVLVTETAQCLTLE